MTLKKKNLIKQVKNFTLNFGPQHPGWTCVFSTYINYYYNIKLKNSTKFSKF